MTNNLHTIAEHCAAIRRGLDSVIMGQTAVKERLLVALLAGGHVLLEGEPGTGKTLLALSLARLLDCRFSRIQFTPDLMPIDVIGTNLYDQHERRFVFQAGPIFTDVLLADEINRTPPKTQSALLECMQESAATVDGTRHEISPTFLVIATQNPVEFEGTYPLPEAQRDRFLLQIQIPAPSQADEKAMLASYAAGASLHRDALAALEPVANRDQLQDWQRALADLVRIDEAVQDYLLALIRATRADEQVQFGAGPRATLALLACSRALALLRGRDFVTPDDIKELAEAVLIHRVQLRPEAELEGLRLEDLLARLFQRIEVPR